LWIELLKNAYYKADTNYTELETLPNLDINIKRGNSLISRYSLDSDLRQALRINQLSIESYRSAVKIYRNAENKEQKRQMEALISRIKDNLGTTLQGTDPKKTKLRQLEGEVYNLENQLLLFPETKAEQKARHKKINQLNNEIDKLRVEIEEIESGRIYDNAFEWRFEFPEVLNDEGDFVGFDIVIGNPPYGILPSKLELSILGDQYKMLGIDNSLKDSYFIFCGLGLQNLLKYNGNLCYIIPNTWKLIDTAKRFRQSLISNFCLIGMDQCQTKIFDATVDCDIIFVETNKKQEYDVKVKLRNRDFTYQTNILSKTTCSKQKFFNFSLTEKEILVRDKIYSQSGLIKDYFKIRNGVKPYEVGKGCPPQTRKIGDDKPYTSETKLNSSFQPLIGGTYFHRYVNLWNKNYWISYGKWLAAPREASIFEASEKLIVRQTSDRIIATFIESGFIMRDNTHIILAENERFSLKYLLGILNSKLIDFIYASNNPEQGEPFAQVKKFHLEMLPFYPISEHKQIPFIKVVDQILDEKTSGLNADTATLEEELDKLIYQLYELTEEEIKIVEGDTETT